MANPICWQSHDYLDHIHPYLPQDLLVRTFYSCYRPTRFVGLHTGGQTRHLPSIFRDDFHLTIDHLPSQNGVPKFIHHHFRQEPQSVYAGEFTGPRTNQPTIKPTCPVQHAKLGSTQPYYSTPRKANPTLSHQPYLPSAHSTPHSRRQP